MKVRNAQRVFRDHDVLQALLAQYERCASARADLFERETAACRAWRENFVANSLTWARESEAHVSDAMPGQEKDKRETGEAEAPRAKHVCFAEVVAETR
jgi:hypothetical protein